MPTSECRVELLIGRRVVDAAGDVVGRLEEIVADYGGGEYLVREFHVGAFAAPAGALAAPARLGGGLLGNALLRLLGGHRLYRGYVVPWHLMDLTDPDHPRVTVAKETLRRIDETRHPSSSVRSAARPRRTA